jgi:hypothetical protein
MVVQVVNAFTEGPDRRLDGRLICKRFQGSGSTKLIFCLSNPKIENQYTAPKLKLQAKRRARLALKKSVLWHETRDSLGQFVARPLQSPRRKRRFGTTCRHLHQTPRRAGAA